ncbi:FAD-binding protein [Rhizorhabdus histidinilytica]
MAFDREVDLLVVGTGAGALVAALRAAKAGAEVLVVERGRCGAAPPPPRAAASGFRAAIWRRRPATPTTSTRRSAMSAG